MSLDVLTKIEQGRRPVDADDLVALALALDTTPNRLLLPEGAANDEYVKPTENLEMNEGTAWRWATGDVAMRDLWGDAGQSAGSQLARQLNFHSENRPHDRRPVVTDDELREHAEALDTLVQAAEAAAERGVPWGLMRALLAARDHEGDHLLWDVERKRPADSEGKNDGR